MDKLLDAIKKSLRAVTHSRYFKTERGFQGAFQAQLVQCLPSLQIEGAIIEEEYQKRMRDHGIIIRPDIIVHVPFDPTIHKSRRQGNFVVFELKLSPGERQAQEDYRHLASMCEVLNYPLGVFINIGSERTYFESYNGPYKERLYAFAVQFRNGETKIIETV